MTKTKLETEITNVLCQLAVLRIIENATPIVIPCSTEIMVIWPGPGFGTMEGESSGRVTAFLDYDDFNVYSLDFDRCGCTPDFDDYLLDVVIDELEQHEWKLQRAKAIHGEIDWDGRVEGAMYTVFFTFDDSAGRPTHHGARLPRYH